MKVAVTAEGDTLTSKVDPRFGRCQYMIFFDTDTEAWHAAPNPALGDPGGAGILVAQFVAEKDVDALITGNIGPNAARGLSAHGIKVYVGAQGTVEESLAALKKGELTWAQGPTVQRKGEGFRR